MPQPPAQPLLTEDISGRLRRRRCPIQRPVPHRLVWPLNMIMLDVLAADVVQVLTSEHDELIEALPLDRLHEPLDVGILARRAESQWPHSQTARSQGAV